MANTATSKKQTKQTAQASAPATGLAATAAQVSTAVQAAPTAKVPASHAVLASLNAGQKGTGALPPSFVPFANYVVVATPKGLAAQALQNRMAPTAKNGPCPFLVALWQAAQAGQTLGQAWAPVAGLAGHGQQGRGAGGYSASNALAYYVKQTNWFALVAP